MGGFRQNSWAQGTPRKKVPESRKKRARFDGGERLLNEPESGRFIAQKEKVFAPEK